MRNFIKITYIALLVCGQAACIPVFDELSDDERDGIGSELLLFGLAGDGLIATHTVSGSLTDGFGQPLADAELQCTSNGNSTGTIRTDANGNLTIQLMVGSAQCQGAGGVVMLTVFANGSVSIYAASGITFVPLNPGPVIAVVPSDLRARGRDERVELRWSPTLGATGYTVYWNTVGNVTTADSQITGLTGPAFDHTGRTNGVTYYYRMAAVNAVGTSEPGNEASAVANPGAPPTPEHLQAQAMDGAVKLTWEAAPRATSYVLFWAERPGVYASSWHVRLSGPGTSYTHTGRVNGSTYYYRLMSIGTYGNSGFSNETSATAGSVPDE
ncbi:MAG: fibronectin type III domain-containing protein [bacterium]|nr:fibronectin type III domain-containing protein [bacterium]